MTHDSPTAVVRLRNNERLFGVMLRFVRNPAAALMAQHAGLDFFMLDMEHGSYDIQTAADIFTAAAAAGIDAWVRVPELTRGQVSRVLDCGARGVMVPMVETREQAEALVSWAKYPPVGGRGLGTCGGNTGYRHGAGAAEVMAGGNAGTLTIAQIETAKAIENIDAIASVEGLDALLIGPNDLAVSLGFPGNTDTPEEARAIGKVADAAEKRGKIFGMHASKEMLSQWAGRGLRIVMHSLDVNILAAGLKSVAGDARAAVSETQGESESC